MQTQSLREIGTIARALDSIANVEFKPLHLNRGQYLFLTRIAEHPGIIANQLANALSIDRTTTARSVKKLVAQGLVIKKRNQANQKNLELFVTAAGQKLAQQILTENLYSERALLQDLSVSEQKQLKQLLAKVAKRAQASWQFVKKGGKREYSWKDTKSSQ